MAGIAYDRALQLDEGNDAARAKLGLIRDVFPGRPLRGVPAPPATARAGRPPAPAAAPAPAPILASISTDERAAILGTLRSWAQAWSSRDVARYLGFYAAGFTPVDGSLRAEWAQRRRVRLGGQRVIEVTLSDLDVGLSDSGEVQVTFTQEYRSDTFQDRMRKRVTLDARRDEWKITREQPAP